MATGRLPHCHTRYCNTCCPEPLAPCHHESPLPPPLSSLSLPTVIVAIIVGTILLIWNDDWTKLPKLTCRRVKMEPVRPNSESSAFLLLPSGMSI